MKIGDLTLRPACKADERIIWEHISGILLGYGIITNPETTDRDLANLDDCYGPGKGAFYLLLDGGKLIGTAAYRLDPPHGAEICRMYLSSAYRGQGIGRRLLEHLTKEAGKAGVTRLYLKTSSVLQDAISLYRKAGFTEDSETCVAGNCDMTMVRTITPPHAH